jgi:hypothetical protein
VTLENVDWSDESIPIPRWLESDWPPLTPAEVAALAVRTRAAVDAAPAAERLLLAAALRTGRSSVRWDYPLVWNPDDEDGADVIVTVADRDVLRVARAALGGVR